MEIKDAEASTGTKIDSKSIYIKVTEDGPYLIYGQPSINEQIIIPNEEGDSWSYQEGECFNSCENPCSLCRCGASLDKPFCSGEHIDRNWDAKETASLDSFLNGAEQYEGPELIMADNEIYCALARFCDAYGDAWNIVERAETSEDIELAKREVSNCPSGRLVIFDKKSKKVHEPHLEPSIGIIEDPGFEVSGPIWVRGGIRIESADGNSYEIRNRVTLCRCGGSSNKPFCDGTHARK